MGIAEWSLSGLQPLARKYKCRLGAANKQPTLHNGTAKRGQRLPQPAELDGGSVKNYAVSVCKDS